MHKHKKSHTRDGQNTNWEHKKKDNPYTETKIQARVRKPGINTQYEKQSSEMHDMLSKTLQGNRDTIEHKQPN